MEREIEKLHKKIAVCQRAISLCDNKEKIAKNTAKIEMYKRDISYIAYTGEKPNFRQCGTEMSSTHSLMKRG